MILKTLKPQTLQQYLSLQPNPKRFLFVIPKGFELLLLFHLYNRMIP